MTKTTEADIAFIRALAETLREHDLTEIEVEREYGDDDELKVRLTRASTSPQPIDFAVPVAESWTPAAPAPEPAATPEAPEGEPVTSPMVGTCYLSPEPGAEPFVRVGDTVAEGETLVIIEAMKTMNQIPSPRAGTVRAIHVSNGEPIEYGATLVTLD